MLTKENLPEPRLERSAISAANEGIVLTLRVISATDLKPMDRNGKADPYVVLTCGETNGTQKTDVIKRSLTPSWNSLPFVFTSVDASDVCVAKLFDWDRFTKDEPMGEVSLKYPAAAWSHF